MKLRYRWIYQITKHIGNVRIFILRDETKSKSEYTSELWNKDANLVRAFAGQHIDAVFCGSDYDENNFWGRCYPEAKLKIIRRDEKSSSEIRRNVYAHWDWLPSVVRPYYVKKVLLVGSESTGKSTLTVNLANYYNTNYIEEVGRDISERSGTDRMMLSEDFTDILLRHKVREIETIKNSNRIIFQDTDCLTTLFYLEFLYGEIQGPNATLAEAIALFNAYDLILFMKPDVDFIQDGDRSELIAANRLTYSNRLQELRVPFEDNPRQLPTAL